MCQGENGSFTQRPNKCHVELIWELGNEMRSLMTGTEVEPVMSLMSFSQRGSNDQTKVHQDVYNLQQKTCLAFCHPFKMISTIIKYTSRTNDYVVNVCQHKVIWII